MPRDRRLYMTFPIDFDEHPKVEALSDGAFRAFVSMNGYSRRHDLDGSIPALLARKKWKPRVLDELVASHPERPLVLLEDGVYVIRDYAEHQFTTADLEDLKQKRSRAGALGGAAKAAAQAKQTGSKGLASAKANAKQLAKQTGSRDQGSGKYQDLTGHPDLSSTPAEDDMSQLDPVIAAVVRATEVGGLRISPLGAPALIRFIDDRRGPRAQPIKLPIRYYPNAIAESWPEVSKFIHEEGIAS